MRGVGGPRQGGAVYGLYLEFGLHLQKELQDTHLQLWY